MKTAKIHVELTKGTIYKIDPKKKYLVIFPSAANIKEIAPALAEFFKPTKAFILTAEQVNQIRLTELVEQ